MKSSVALAMLATLSTTGCDMPTLRDRDTASLGIVPLVAVGRSGLGKPLRLRGAGGVDVSMMEHAVLSGMSSLCYIPFEQQGGGGRGSLFRLDILGLMPGSTRGYWVTAFGPSILFMDFDSGARGEGSDMFGVGGFIRIVRLLCLGTGPWRVSKRKIGLEVHAVVHGWLGFDRYAVQVAGSAEAGVSIVFGF